MAINKNHLFDDLNGIKCAIVESDVTPQRTEFIKRLLEFNGFQVVIVPFVASKKPAVAIDPAAVTETAPTPVESFTIGVTDLTFNSTNAVFGRLLKTEKGKIVTMAYWQQKENISHDEIPYFEFKG